MVRFTIAPEEDRRLPVHAQVSDASEGVEQGDATVSGSVGQTPMPPAEHHIWGLGFGFWGSEFRVHIAQALWFMRREVKRIDQPARTFQIRALRPNVRAVRGP